MANQFNVELQGIFFFSRGLLMGPYSSIDEVTLTLLLPLFLKDAHKEGKWKIHEQVWPRGSLPDYVSTLHCL